VRCSNRVVASEYVETYCMQELGHAGECDKFRVTAEKQLVRDAIERCPHGFASRGTCPTCRNTT